MAHPVDHPSPNREPRPDGAAIDILLIHYTGMLTGAAALERLCQPDAKVSAHYLIEEDGRVVRLVPERLRAWHAGVACWAGKTDINDRSIGIELVNPGHEFGYRPFPEPQMAALIELAQAICARHPIPAHRVLGHSDVAPERKQDPGELFDWPRLARHGLGVWPRALPEPSVAPGLDWFLPRLARAGYCANADPAALLTAFQRRFRPETVTGAPDTGTAARLTGLLKILSRAG
ncbi:N-acetylmuramoyl-L-alanine amidase [Rhodovibrio sodomensis]|uniref:N-acetylmuramoyl-L-alanine amidase n=1 Tax=Rhodovibrio sodomensis TaxID=1088 RepID=A0ABS1D983_9PROT|nr:N-acetylmuramoyl-L-alanine amidase [Rhodovibrio sodomensis]MBK1666809.1 N-acetylmuramoyl-L-alanine amidase [Rhodovibrio sodomensis]